jgi:hypothetical protein
MHRCTASLWRVYTQASRHDLFRPLFSAKLLSRFSLQAGEINPAILPSAQHRVTGIYG